MKNKETTYVDVNETFFNKWVADGWEWGTPITHEIYEQAKQGNWDVVLTPTKTVPKDWFCEMKGAKILGLASGGGQQMPIFAALGADCTVMDYSKSQLESERLVAQREAYSIELVKGDMTKRFPFEDESFDLIFHPVSNCYVEDVYPIWKECYRVLKKGGILISGLDNGVCFAFNDEGTKMEYPLPFNPLNNKKLYEESVKKGWGIQFSHTLEEQIGGQLKAGFTLKDIYQDTSGEGNFRKYNIPTFFATKSIK